LISGRRIHTGLIRVPLTVLTFALVCLGWIFFRAKTLPAAQFVFSQLISPVHGASLFTPWHWRLAALSLLIALGEEYGSWLSKLETAPTWVTAGVTAVALLAIELFGITENQVPFVYFQF
jgi:hypothetical protein